MVQKVLVLVIFASIAGISNGQESVGNCTTEKEHLGQLMTWLEFCNKFHHKECITNNIYVVCGACLPEYDNWMNKTCNLKTCDSIHNDKTKWKDYCHSLELACQQTDKGPNCTDPCESKPCLNGDCELDKSKDDFKCNCFPSFSGKLCEIAICNPDCGSEATCQGIDGKPACYCNKPGHVFDPIDKKCRDVCHGIECQNGGTCEGDATAPGGFKCECREGFHGDRCEEFQCNPECPNDATCDLINSKPVCSCNDMNLVYFQDRNICKDPCEDDPCNGKGTCNTDLTEVDKFRCDCEDGYHGKKCELQRCDPTCSDDAECKKVDENTYKCECYNIHLIFNPSDQKCIDPCEPDPCNGKGTCRRENDSYKCECDEGYHGTTCELQHCDPACPVDADCMKIDENSFQCKCDYQDFIFDEVTNTCKNPCETNPCEHDGECVLNNERPGKFECNCKEGFDGDTCEELICDPQCPQDVAECELIGSKPECRCKDDDLIFVPTEDKCIDPCLDVPCKHGGTCTKNQNEPNGYICHCKLGYLGDHCELQHCRPACPDDASCEIDGPLHFKCDCWEFGFVFNATAHKCQHLCDPNPCQNGGTCSVDLTDRETYKCQCSEGFDGRNCQEQKCHPECPLDVADCREVAGAFECVCKKDGFIFEPDEKRCKDPCKENPCKHDGICTINTNKLGNFQCNCKEGFGGDTCEELICNPQCPQDVAECELIGSKPECRCKDDDLIFVPTEDKCIDPCDPSPCSNGGTCTKDKKEDGGYKCKCPLGFHGQNCETPTCDDLDCGQEADCEVISGSPKCVCRNDQLIYELDRMICRDPCENNPCEHGGSCSRDENKDGGFMCSCKQGFHGDHCEGFTCTQDCGHEASCDVIEGDFTLECLCTNTNFIFNASTTECQDPCEPNPCENDGACATDKTEDGFYKCTCLEGFQGKDCQELDCQPECGSDSDCQLEGNVVQCVCNNPQFMFDIDDGKCKDPCESNSCNNGGTCTTDKNEEGFYKCTCPIGFTGKNCQELDCQPECGTEATCELEGNVVQCVCIDPQLVFFPEEQRCTDPCLSLPCQNGGTCINDKDQENKYKCDCPLGFSGQNCEQHFCNLNCGDEASCEFQENVPTCVCNNPQHVFDAERMLCKDPCSPNPCQNGGICSTSIEEESHYTCNCTEWFHGQNCEIFSCDLECGTDAECQFVEFNLKKCVCKDPHLVFRPEDKTCKDPCQSEPCQNGGTCVNDINEDDKYRCDCPIGFEGKNCEQHFCHLDCGDEASCEFQDNVPTCVCNNPQHVFDAESRVCKDPCSPNPCENGGTCSNSIEEESHYTCNCTDEFHGQNCEISSCDLDCGTDAECQFVELNHKKCVCKDSQLVFRPEDKTCTDPCQDVHCLHGGTCRKDEQADKGYSCTCMPGFHGDDCGEFTCHPECPKDASCHVIEEYKPECICHDGNFFFDEETQTCREIVTSSTAKPDFFSSSTDSVISSTTLAPGGTCDNCSLYHGVCLWDRCQCRPTFTPWKDGEFCRLANSTFFGNLYIGTEMDPIQNIYLQEELKKLIHLMSDVYADSVLWITLVNTGFLQLRSQLEPNRAKVHYYNLTISIQFSSDIGSGEILATKLFKCVPNSGRNCPFTDKLKLVKTADKFSKGQACEVDSFPELICPEHSKCQVDSTKSRGYSCHCEYHYTDNEKQEVGEGQVIEICRYDTLQRFQLAVILGALGTFFGLALLALVIILRRRRRGVRRNVVGDRHNEYTNPIYPTSSRAHEHNDNINVELAFRLPRPSPMPDRRGKY